MLKTFLTYYGVAWESGNYHDCLVWQTAQEALDHQQWVEYTIGIPAWTYSFEANDYLIYCATP